jgi:hypothetical protein
MQRQLDERQQWNTRGFISGYRGSPLGMVDQVIWKQGEKFTNAGIEFVPAINEELGATQVLGTQRVESDPERTVDGVFGLWYTTRSPACRRWSGARLPWQTCMKPWSGCAHPLSACSRQATAIQLRRARAREGVMPMSIGSRAIMAAHLGRLP